MGYSMTPTMSRRLSALQAEGRLCKGPAQRYCTSRATRAVVMVSVMPSGRKNEGTLVMCGKHAKGFPIGMEGTNFKVADNSRLSWKF